MTKRTTNKRGLYFLLFLASAGALHSWVGGWHRNAGRQGRAKTEGNSPRHHPIIPLRVRAGHYHPEEPRTPCPHRGRAGRGGHRQTPAPGLRPNGSYHRQSVTYPLHIGCNLVTFRNNSSLCPAHAGHRRHVACIRKLRLFTTQKSLFPVHTGKRRHVWCRAFVFSFSFRYFDIFFSSEFQISNIWSFLFSVDIYIFLLLVNLFSFGYFLQKKLQEVRKSFSKLCSSFFRNCQKKFQ